MEELTRLCGAEMLSWLILTSLREKCGLEGCRITHTRKMSDRIDRKKVDKA